MALSLARPVVSFTFDDAPVTAFARGGSILREHGAAGTYYVSLGLLGQTTEIGAIGSREHLLAALDEGHELGCHTYGHVDAWDTPLPDYVASIEENERALHRLMPGQRFRTFAYPKNGATRAAKRALAGRFDACRGGGQTFNNITVDLNMMSACFLDRRARMDLRSVQSLIDDNAVARGWLIFAAHDISMANAPYACSPSLLNGAVRHALASGAEILPVSSMLARLGALEVRLQHDVAGMATPLRISD